MKNSIKLVDTIICVIAVFVVCFIGCGPKEVPLNQDPTNGQSQSDSTSSNGNSETSSRIKIKYDDGYNAHYQIIEVDGVEYVAPISGGITPLIK
jgi:hypothetical protein